MTSFEPNENNRLDRDDLRLEIDSPEVIAFSIPKRQSGISAPIRLNVHFDNHTSTPVPITLCGTLTPKLTDLNGRFINFSAPQQLPYEDESVGDLVLPGESTLESLEARLFWDIDKLRLLIPIRFYIFQENLTPLNLSEYWVSEALEAKTYKLQFIYNSPSVPIWRCDSTTGERLKFQAPSIEDLATSSLHLSIIEPLLNSKAIEVEGIRFETVVPQFGLTIKKREQEIWIQLGMAIKNNTSIPFLFSSYSALTPDLISPDGLIMPRYYSSNYYRQAEETDFHLLNPGESQTFFWDASLAGLRRSGEKLRRFHLNFPISNGGMYSFGNLKSGKYQLQFSYEKPKFILVKKSNEWQPIEPSLPQPVWSGCVSLPSVNLDLFLS